MIGLLLLVDILSAQELEGALRYGLEWAFREQRDALPEAPRKPSDFGVRPTKWLPTVNTDHVITCCPELFDRPSGDVFVEWVIGRRRLYQEPIGCEHDHAFRCHPLHVCQECDAFGFRQML